MPPELRWPTVWKLPFGFRVQIRRVSKALIRRRAGDSVRGLFSGWDWKTKLCTIYVNRDWPLDEQLDSLSHEMSHALTDWDGWVQDKRVEVIKERLATEAALARDASAERS